MFQDKTENKYKILDLIDIKYLDDFENWRNIVWSMKKENYSKEDAIQLSKKSNKYDEKGFNNVWENSPSNILFSQGTLNYFSKLSNQEEYFKLVDYGYTKIFNDYTDEGLAQIVVNEMETILIYQDGDLYIYYNDTWIKNNDE